MGWEPIKWRCGHEGRMQMYGPSKSRDYKATLQRERKCMACWLIGVWKKENDINYFSSSMTDLALAISGRKSIEIEHPKDEDGKNRHFLGTDYENWKQSVKDFQSDEFDSSYGFGN